MRRYNLMLDQAIWARRSLSLSPRSTPSLQKMKTGSQDILENENFDPTKLAWNVVSLSWQNQLLKHAFDSHNTATATWFFLTTSLSLRPQSIFQKTERCPVSTVMDLCLVNTKLCLKSVSWQRSTSPTVFQGFESRAKYYPSFELATRFTEHAVTIIHSVRDAIDYLHSILSPPLPSPTWQTRELVLPLQRPWQWQWHCLLWHVSPPSFSPTLFSSFHRAKLLHSPDEQLTSLNGSFDYIS